MMSALAIDGRRGPDLPAEYRVQQRREEPEHSEELKSPLPPEWSDATKSLRETAHQLEDLLGDK